MGGKPIRPKLEEEVDYVINAYQSGKSIDDLAQEFSCSATPIRQFLQSHNIPFRAAVRPRKLGPLKDRIEALYRNGHSTIEIAEHLNVDRNTVSSFLDHMGIRRNAPLAARTFHICGEVNKGIFAGLLVGEGTIVIRGNGAAIRIVNTDQEIINWLSQWGGNVYWTKRRPRSTMPCGVWDLAAAVNVFHCLNAVLPYMIGAKHKLAIEAIHHIKENYGLEAIDELEGL